MPQPFFNLPNCPDAANVQVPPAIARTGLIANCEIPDAPDPVFQCPLPKVDIPGIYGAAIIQIQITARTGSKHEWVGVDSDGAGGWVLNGLQGTIAAGSEGYEINGGTVEPSAAVFMARKPEGLSTVVFWLNPSSATLSDNFKYIQLTAGPDVDGFYDWQEVAPDDWHTTGTTGTATGGDGASELTGFGPIVDPTVYMARHTNTGKYSFMAVRRVYYIRLSAGPDGSGNYDWAEYELGNAGTWAATGFAKTAASTHGAIETVGQVVRADNLTIYTARQNGKGKMTFYAPQIPFWIQLTAGPDGSGLYDWKQYEDNGAGGWAAVSPAVTGGVGDTPPDGAREALNLPAFPADGVTYLARRAKNGQVVFHTITASSGFMAIAPGGGVPPKSGSTAGSVSCQLVQISDTGVISASTVHAMVWNPYATAMGINSSLAAPMQMKIVQGKLIVDVDPCGS